MLREKLDKALDRDFVYLKFIIFYVSDKHTIHHALSEYIAKFYL